MGYRTKTGRAVKLIKDLKEGGEGKIWTTDTGMVAKIYKDNVLKSNNELREKIEYMCSNLPSQWILDHTAWPKEALYDDSGRFVGFLMDDYGAYRGISKLYTYYQSGKYPDGSPVDYTHKVAVATMLAHLVNEMHSMGGIIGDFNPKNLGYVLDVNSSNPIEIVFFDSDSFPIKTQSGKLFKCKVSYPGYTAPELIDAFDRKTMEFLSKGITKKPTYEDIDEVFSKDTDIFALGVHVFQLLMNGFHPYAGVDMASVQQSQQKNEENYHSSTPTVNKHADLNSAVFMDEYCLKPGWMHGNVSCLHREDCPDYITSLFDRTFRKLGPGEHRPDASEWVSALIRLIKESTICGKNSYHVYWNGLSYCPYCAAWKRFDEKLHLNKSGSNSGSQAPVQSIPAPATSPSNSSPLSRAKLTKEGNKRIWQ
ncbi:MAG: hypothetical protein RBR71_11440 [Gudongella sp.]|nr:hypothetical protein [Gudongella sp.]